MKSQNLLKFCYFFSFIVLTACGDGTKSVRNTASEVSVENNSTAAEQDKQSIVFFGNSLTAGLGVLPEQAFPGLIASKIDSLKLPYAVINAGLSGETTGSGVNRLAWVLQKKPDIFVLELGANDGLRGIPLEETRKNLVVMVEKVRNLNPEVKIIITGMQMPPNMGPEYTGTFREIFPEIAKSQNILLVPFLLEGVGGIPELNQPDGIHPTAEGHKILAENVWEVLGPLIRR